MFYPKSKKLNLSFKISFDHTNRFYEYCFLNDNRRIGLEGFKT